MIRLICFLICVFVINNALFSQGVPKFFNYQVSVRDAAGMPLILKQINFQISISDNINGINPVFQETNSMMTNNNGIANFQIGNGKPVKGSLSIIPFLRKEYFISIAVDTDNKSNFKHISSTQLISVPYAMVADSAKYASKVDQLSQNGASNGQILKWNSSLNKWEPSNDIGGGVGDNWGGQSAVTNAPLIGNGTISSPLTISSNGVNNGQILKWNSSINKWVPSNDLEGSTGGFTHYIGELYGGGIIFYVYKDNLNREHGLVVDTSSNLQFVWGDNNTLIGKANSSWDGLLNSNEINSASSFPSYAANAALNYKNGIYTDWYLPSIDELILLGTVRFILNMTIDKKNNPTHDEITLNEYWSSTEFSRGNARTFKFGDNMVSNVGKDNIRNCRFIRRY